MCRAPGSRRKGAARVFNTDRASEACVLSSAHGSAARTVQERKWFRTGQLHGPCSWFRLSTGRVREACALISSVARGVLINTDRVRYLACTGLGWLCTGRVCDFWFYTGRVLGSARGVHFGTGHLFCMGHSRFCTGRAIFLLLR